MNTTYSGAKINLKFGVQLTDKYSKNYRFI